MVPLHDGRRVRQAFLDNAAGTRIKRLLSIARHDEKRLEKAIRAGDRSEIPGGVRASIGIHNDEEDSDRFLARMQLIVGREGKGGYALDRSTGEFRPEGQGFDFSSLRGLEDPLG